MSNLIKCLECRLVGAPPAFNMPPPPVPPAEFIRQFNLSNKLITDQLRQIKLKKCLEIKNSNLATNLNESNVKRVQSSLLSSSSLESILHNLTPDQSLYIFLTCLVIFIVVLIVAFVFIYKLIRLRSELKKTYSKSANLLTENGSINSNLAITRSSSTIDDKSQFASYNLIPLYDSASSNSNVSTASKNTSTSYLFYNQLFESTKQFMVNSSSSSPKSNPSDYYLHGVPNNSNLIESHLINSKKLARPQPLQEYAEINHQCHQMDKLYNQYDDAQKVQMIVQPVLPIRHLIHYPTPNGQILNAQHLQTMSYVC